MYDIKYFKSRYDELKNSRADFEADWISASKFLSPSTGFFLTDPKNEKNKRKYTYPKENLNGKPQRDMRDLSTSLLATLCPADSRWFGLQVYNQTKSEQSWLHKAAESIMHRFQANGVSTYIESMLYEGSIYGLGVMSVEKSRKKVLDFSAYTIGEYYLDEDFEGNEDTLYHKFSMNSRQLKEWFGLDKLPEQIRNELIQGGKFNNYNIIQAIEPNPDFLPEWENVFNKPFVSCTWVEGISDDQSVLEIKGMDDFPFIVFHWYRKINSVYTMGIGHDIMGDVRTLQDVEKDTAKARKKNLAPPLLANTTFKNTGVNTSSNGVNYSDSDKGVKSLYDVRFQTEEGIRHIETIENRLDYLTYKNIFGYIMSNPKTRTAEEIKKISQEEMILLGGIVQNAMISLGKLVERSFKLMYEQGELPENMPESLRGKTMNVSFHSLLSQSQSLSDLVLVERWIQAMSILATINPVVSRKIDIFKIADNYAKRLDIDMDQVISTEDVIKQVNAEQEAQAQAAATQQQAVNAESLSVAAKNFASAETIAGDV
jgi:hypothetical protein